MCSQKQREKIILEAIFDNGHPDSSQGKRDLPTSLDHPRPIGKGIPIEMVGGSSLWWSFDKAIFRVHRPYQVISCDAPTNPEPLIPLNFKIQ